MPFQGFLRSNKGTPQMDKAFSYFGRNFSFPTFGTGVWAFLLANVEKDQEGGGIPDGARDGDAWYHWDQRELFTSEQQVPSSSTGPVTSASLMCGVFLRNSLFK